MNKMINNLVLYCLYNKLHKQVTLTKELPLCFWKHIETFPFTHSLSFYPTWHRCASYLFLSSSSLRLHPFGVYLPLPSAPLLFLAFKDDTSRAEKTVQFSSIISSSVSPWSLWFYLTLWHMAERTTLCWVPPHFEYFTCFYFTKNVGMSNFGVRQDSNVCFVSSCSPSAMQTSSCQWRLMGLFIR